MKKIVMSLLFLVAMLFIAAGANAAPYIVTAVVPATSIDNYMVSIDGGAAVVSAPQSVTGGVRLHFDVGGLAAGNHTASIVAKKAGCADSSALNFPFTTCVTATPTGGALE